MKNIFLLSSNINEYLPSVNCVFYTDMYILVLVRLSTVERLSAHLIVRCDVVFLSYGKI
jgi:hypothetical protein